MSTIFSKAIKKYSNQGETSTLKNPSPWLLNSLGVKSKGVSISERTSLSLSAFYGGVNIISNHIASLPLAIVVRNKDGNTEDVDHHLNEILKYQANPYLSATHFKKLLMVNALVYGNGFARIEREGNKTTGLYIEKPKDVTILKNKESGDILRI